MYVFDSYAEICVHFVPSKMTQNATFSVYMACVSIRAETIIRTNRLVGYQSTSQCQYYEIG